MLPQLPSYILVLALVAVPAAAVADEPLGADEVIAKYIEAIGGRKVLGSIKSMRTTGKVVMAGGMMEAPMTVEYKRPNKARIEFTFQGMTAVQAFDGTTGWFIMPFAGKLDPEKMSSDQVKIIKEEADIDGPLVDYKKKGHQVELIGKDEEDGSEVYKLKVTRKNGDTDYFFLDAEYFLPIKRTGKREMQGNDVEFAVSFGDYKEVGGLMLAYSIEQTIGAMSGNTMTLDKVEMNVELSDDRFAMPEVKKAVTTEETEAEANKVEDKTSAERKEKDDDGK